MKKVNIFGSCCSRELFNYQNKYDISCYVMQQSIFTLFANPLKITYEQAKGTDESEFKKRMMYYEFNKMGLDQILNTKSDFLVIDFADCRYDIYEFDNPKGVKIIYTHESRATFDNIKDDPEFKDIEKHYCNVVEEFDDFKIEEILRKFCNQILKVYKPNQIILNKIKMSKYYYEAGDKKELKDNFHYSRKDFIEKIENIFLKLMPNCKVLDTKEDALLNINHRFGGPHPMHYEDIYYDYRMKLLDCIMNDKSTNEVEEEYKNTYSNNIETIKNKIHMEVNDCSSSKRVD